jgi:hypothetical protein
VVTETGLPAAWPTKTQVVADVQVSPLTAVVGILVLTVHEPPDAVPTTYGAGDPLKLEPAASHNPLEHATTSSVAEPAGVDTDDQLAPPLVVTASNADAAESCAMPGLGPIATHVVPEEHATERSTPVPPFTVLVTHVLPPSVLTSTDDPTATQNLVVGQATDPMAPTDVGKFADFHVVPPSDERSSSPAYGPAVPGETPALTQSELEGHETLSSVVFGVGTFTDVHVSPPSLDCAATP